MSRHVHDTELAEFDDLHDVFDRVTNDLFPPLDLHLRVRRGARRRRLGRGAGVISAIAAAAAVIVVTAPFGGSGPTPGTLRIATQPTSDVQTGWWKMPAAEMHRRLADELPAISDPDVPITSWVKQEPANEVAPGDSRKVVGNLLARLAGSTGPGSIEIMLREPVSPDASGDGDTSQVISCPPDVEAEHVHVTECRSIMDAHGKALGRLLETKSRPSGDTSSGNALIVREVQLNIAGANVYVASANSVGEKWGVASSAKEPPLTLDQLRQIAEMSWYDWRPTAS